MPVHKVSEEEPLEKMEVWPHAARLTDGGGGVGSRIFHFIHAKMLSGQRVFQFVQTVKVSTLDNSIRQDDATLDQQRARTNTKTVPLFIRKASSRHADKYGKLLADRISALSLSVAEGVVRR